MKLRNVVLFTLLFASVLLLAACDKEERKEYHGNGVLKSVTTYCKNIKEGKYISYYWGGEVNEMGF